MIRRLRVGGDWVVHEDYHVERTEWQQRYERGRRRQYKISTEKLDKYDHLAPMVICVMMLDIDTMIVLCCCHISS
jgi:hypothetical protein